MGKKESNPEHNREDITKSENVQFLSENAADNAAEFCVSMQRM